MFYMSVVCCRTGRKSMDYGDVVEEAFNTGPARLQRFSMAAKLVHIHVDFFDTLKYSCSSVWYPSERFIWVKLNAATDVIVKEQVIYNLLILVNRIVYYLFLTDDLYAVKKLFKWFIINYLYFYWIVVQQGENIIMTDTYYGLNTRIFVF